MDIIVEGIMVGGVIVLIGGVLACILDSRVNQKPDDYRVGDIVTLKNGKRFVYKGNGGWKELEMKNGCWVEKFGTIREKK